ncbi:MAG: RnfABCDGE type electron transport complex subunit G [Bacteroidales bacterium]|jgi:electron transport complex protein RnfG|nr:RnfABCDGE type electron transport complex subunit G [Bacteroidales bacterium]
MAKLESSLKNMFLSLTLITLGASALLAGGYVLTKEPIEKADRAKEENAIKEVLPDKNAEVLEKVEITLENKADPFIVYPSVKDGKFAGAAVQTYSTEGYGGRLDIMVGFDTDGTIVNYAVLKANETPGLGAKVTDWFKNDSKKTADIRGKNPATTKVSVSKDGGDIDAITASTITSRAFLQSVQLAYEAFQKMQTTKK